MEGWGGNAPVAGLSAEAAQALRDAAQEDFEVYEASDEDGEMGEASVDLSEEGDISPLLYPPHCLESGGFVITRLVLISLFTCRAFLTHANSLSRRCTS